MHEKTTLVKPIPYPSHLLTGNDADAGPKTKTACGLMAEDTKGGFFWKFREHVTCAACIKRIDSIDTMRSTS